MTARAQTDSEGAPGATGAPEAAHAERRFVFVVGHAFCGSTLLGRMLNSHPALFCPGEMLRIQDAFEDGYPCSCDAPLDTCPFWTTRLPLINQAARHNYRKTTLADYDRLRRHEQARALVDTSKTRIYRLRRTLCRPRETAVIHLVRDLRGVLASHLRRGHDFRARLATTVKWAARFERLQRTLKDRAVHVFYEDLVESPESTLRALCVFIGVPYDAALLTPSRAEHHFIHASISPYLRGTDKLSKDERWKEELSPDQINETERAMRKSQILRDRYLEG